MRIDKNILARIYSFDLQFKGGKRTKFYRKLFGFRSKTKREDKNGHEKVYEHFYPGLLTSLPHLRLGKSVIAVPKKAMEEVNNFFEDPKWSPIDLYSFDGIIPQDDRMTAMREVPGRIKVTRGETLESEIENLLNLKPFENQDSEVQRRAKRVIERCEELMNYNWTDDSKFSKDLRQRIAPLKENV